MTNMVMWCYGLQSRLSLCIVCTIELKTLSYLDYTICDVGYIQKTWSSGIKGWTCNASQTLQGAEHQRGSGCPLEEKERTTIRIAEGR